MKKVRIPTRVWVLLIGALLALSLLALLLLSRRSAGPYANIYLDGVCVWSVDLSAAEEEEPLLLEGDGGNNLVVIQPGRVCVAAADCPDQVCVQQGWLTEEGGMPIVCLPHGLVIQVEDHPGK